LLELLKELLLGLAKGLVERLNKLPLWSRLAILLILGTGLAITVYHRQIETYSFAVWGATFHRDEARVPESSRTNLIPALNEMGSELRTGFDDYKGNDSTDLQYQAWNIAQIDVALWGLRVNDSVGAPINKVEQYLLESADRNDACGCGRGQNCLCWRELKETTPSAANPVHLGVTAWAAFSLAHHENFSSTELAAAARFLAESQNSDGSWCAYMCKDLGLASTYATAWALIALCELQSSRHQIDDQLRKTIVYSIERAKSWLRGANRDRCPNKDWPLYPAQATKICSKSVSGLVIFALIKSNPQCDIQSDIDAWYETLPDILPEADDSDIFGEWIVVGNGTRVKDSVHNLKWPWYFIGTAVTYPRASWIQRIKALAYLTKAVNAVDVARKQLGGKNWIEAELLFALRSLNQAN
jgi:hypothetical protein